MRIATKGVLAGVGLLLASSTSVLAQELTILWAEWDPANYLQELVNEYQAETGVTVTVETVPWPDFQTKAFTEFNAKGSAYDMVVGDSQWIGAASEAGHYVDLSEFFAKHKLTETMAPATVKYYAEYPAASGKYWSVPAEGDAVGWSYRKDWFEDPKEMEAFKAKYGYDLAPPADFKQLRDIAEFFHRPDEKRYGVAIYTDKLDGDIARSRNLVTDFEDRRPHRRQAPDRFRLGDALPAGHGRTSWSAPCGSARCTPPCPTSSRPPSARPLTPARAMRSARL